jgi:hypothetical protein
MGFVFDFAVAPIAAATARLMAHFGTAAYQGCGLALASAFMPTSSRVSVGRQLLHCARPSGLSAPFDSPARHFAGPKPRLGRRGAICASSTVTSRAGGRGLHLKAPPQRPGRSTLEPLDFGAASAARAPSS